MMSTFNSGEPSYEPWKVTANAPISFQGPEPVGTSNSVPVPGPAGVPVWRVGRKAVRVNKRRWLALAALLTLALIALALNGCTSTNERSQSATQRTQITERHPTPDGGYVEKVTEYTEGEKSKETTTKADVDWAGAVSKGVGQAVTGDWLGLGITAGTMLAAGGAAVVSERKRRLRAEANEDEVYKDLKAMKGEA